MVCRTWGRGLVLPSVARAVIPQQLNVVTNSRAPRPCRKRRLPTELDGPWEGAAASGAWLPCALGWPQLPSWDGMVVGSERAHSSHVILAVVPLGLQCTAEPSGSFQILPQDS